MNKHVIASLLLMTIVSCGIKKKAIQNKATHDIDREQLILKINKNNTPPEWLFLEGDININESTEKFKIVVKHKKDSITWASIRAIFGIELFRIQITQDSIYFLDRVNQKFLIEPNSYLNKYFKRNDPFITVNSFITSSYDNTKNRDNGNNYYLDNNYGDDIYVLRLEKNVEHHIFAKNYKTYLYVFSEDNNKIECMHLEYRQNKNYMFPAISVLKIFSEKEINIKIENKKVIFDKPQAFKFKIPKKYEKTN